MPSLSRQAGLPELAFSGRKQNTRLQAMRGFLAPQQMEAAAVCARSECRCGIYRLDDDRIQGLHGHAHRPVYLDRYFAGGISTRRLWSRIERPGDIAEIPKLTARHNSM